MLSLFNDYFLLLAKLLEKSHCALPENAILVFLERNRMGPGSTSNGGKHMVTRPMAYVNEWIPSATPR